MALRIVYDSGKGYATKVLDAETGENLTARLQVTKVEITVQEARVQRVCPYCGHEKEHTVRLANDVDGW